MAILKLQICQQKSFIKGTLLEERIKINSKHPIGQRLRRLGGKS